MIFTKEKSIPQKSIPSRSVFRDKKHPGGFNASAAPSLLMTTRFGKTKENVEVEIPPASERQDGSRIYMSSKGLGYSPVQPKLKVGQFNDCFEQEADRVADEVMSMSAQGSESSREAADGCAKNESIKKRKKEVVQTKSISDIDSNLNSSVESEIQNIRQSEGQELSASTLDFMEPRFGCDFSRVRVHTNATAVSSAQSIGAHAYTVGKDIVFGNGEYQPETIKGKQLLAHELTHVVQQGYSDKSAEKNKSSMILTKLTTEKMSENNSQLPAKKLSHSIRPQLIGMSEIIQRKPGGDPPMVPLPPGAQELPKPAQLSWTSKMPYVEFLLHHNIEAHSSRAYLDRKENPNFQETLKRPWVAKEHDVPGWMGGEPGEKTSPNWRWAFFTKFFVDAKDAQLPREYTRLESSTKIRFVPTAGGKGFSYNSSDNKPAYNSPGSSLTTDLSVFNTSDLIKEPGQLQWDARLLVAHSDDRIPLWVDFVPPPGITDKNALDNELAKMGLRRREPVGGEQARRYRVSYTPLANDLFKIQIDITEAGSSKVSQTRTTPGTNGSTLLKFPAFVIAIASDAEQFGNSSVGRRHVEIEATQRVSFEWEEPVI